MKRVEFGRFLRRGRWPPVSFLYSKAEAETVSVSGNVAVTPTTTISGNQFKKKHARIPATNSAFSRTQGAGTGCVLSGSGVGELALEKGKQTV